VDRNPCPIRAGQSLRRSLYWLTLSRNATPLPLQTRFACEKLPGMAKRQIELQRFAAIGALAHIEKLQAEIDRIRKAFPTLRVTGRSTPSSVESAHTPTKVRRKRKMSAAARKRISEAQKARWAKQRGEASKKK
jgi:hypothetical protein